MRAYHSMPTSEFVDQLQDIAIKAGAKPLVMDQLETLRNQDPNEVERATLKRCEDEWDSALGAIEDNLDRAEFGFTKKQIKDILRVVSDYGMEFD